MADRKYTIDIGTTGAQKAKADVAGVDSALAKMGSSALKAGGALFAGAGVIAGYQKLSEFAGVAIQVERVGTAFQNLTTKAGFTGNTLDKLRAGTRGMVSDLELMKQTNNAMLLGVAQSSQQMEEMTVIARRLGAAMGTSTAQALESLTIGIGRQSKLYLDNLGILIDVEQAYQKYARSIGVTSDALTDAQKKIAFTNEAMTKARELVSGLGEDTAGSGDSVERFAAEWENTKAILGQGAIPVLVTLNDTLTILGRTGELLIKSYESKYWKEYLEFWGRLSDRMKGITPEMRAAYDAQIDLENVASDLTEATITLQQVEEARANKSQFQVEKTRALAKAEKDRLDQQKKAAEEKRKLAEEALRPTMEAFEAEQTRNTMLRDSRQAFMEYLRETVPEEIDLTNELAAARAEAGATVEEWLQREGDAQFKKDSEDVARSDREIELLKLKKQAWIDATGSIIGSVASLNASFKGSALVTKRVLQGEAIVNTYAAANKALVFGPGPPLTLPLVAATIAQGLANVAAIESQNYARGGVIEGSGGPMQDNVRINASAGESILNAQATARLGRDGVDNLNSGGGVGVTIVVQGNIIGEESWVRENLIPKIEATIRRRLA